MSNWAVKDLIKKIFQHKRDYNNRRKIKIKSNVNTSISKSSKSSISTTRINKRNISISKGSKGSKDSKGSKGSKSSKSSKRTTRINKRNISKSSISIDMKTLVNICLNLLYFIIISVRT